MRFRGTMGQASFHLVTNVIRDLSRLGGSSHSCGVSISPENIRFSIKPPTSSNSDEGMLGFATLDSKALFHEVICTSRAPNNMIYFVASPSHLINAFQSGKEALVISMRLTKVDGQAYLHLKMRVASEIDVMQKIPITIMSGDTMEQMYYHEPYAPNSNIALEIPSKAAETRVLKRIVEHIKHMGNHVVDLEATMEGKLRVLVRSDHHSVASQTYFRHLIPRPDLTQDDENTVGQNFDKTTKAKVRLNVRQLSKSLNSVLNSAQDNQIQTLICVISEGHTVVLHCILWESAGTVTYFIPVLEGEEHYDEEEEAVP